MADDFYSRCNSKGATITLFQIENGDCIGGFTEASWSSPSKVKFESDPSAVIFNLTQSRRFDYTLMRYSTCCAKSLGPWFGASYGDLCTLN